MIKKWIKNEQGQALILVIGILAVLTMVASAALVYAKNQNITAIRQKKQMQAYYVADAGITRAIAKIKNNPGEYLKPTDNFDNLNGQEYAGGKILEVKLSSEGGGKYTLTSTGIYPASASPELTSRKTIVAKIFASDFTVADLLGGVNFLPKNPQNQHKISGNVTIQGDAGKKGIVMVNKNLHVQSEAADIKADVYASGTITGKKERIKGTLYENYPVPLPTLPETGWFESRAAQTFNGDKTITLEYDSGTGKTTMTVSGGGGSFEPQRNGIYLFKGDVEIEGEYGLPFTIAVTGKIKICHGNKNLQSKNSSEGLLCLISLSTTAQAICGNRGVDALIVANGEFDLRGCSRLYGGITSFWDGSDLAGTPRITCCGVEIARKSVPADLLNFLNASAGLPLLKIETWDE